MEVPDLIYISSPDASPKRSAFLESPNSKESGNYHQLDDNIFRHEVEVDDDVIEIQAQHVSQTSAQAKKQWSIAEDEALISSFIDKSMNPLVRRDSLWEKVVASYQRAQIANPRKISPRNLDEMKDRWQTIDGLVTNWVGCYEEAVRMHRFGTNEEVVIGVAQLLYEDTFAGKFPLLHAWKMLKNYPKWEPMSRGFVIGSSGKRVEIENEPLKRPMGIKKAKRARGRRSFLRST